MQRGRLDNTKNVAWRYALEARGLSLEFPDKEGLQEISDKAWENWETTSGVTFEQVKNVAPNRNNSINFTDESGQETEFLTMYGLNRASAEAYRMIGASPKDTAMRAKFACRGVTDVIEELDGLGDQEYTDRLRNERAKFLIQAAR